MGKIILDKWVMVRMETKDWKKLDDEAKKDGRTLASYIRKLLATHPDRPKKK